MAMAQHFSDPDAARRFLEGQRWPDGAICPHCDSGEVYKLTPKTSRKGKHVRAGVYKCATCREQFTVTVGTIFEDSHIPLNKWLFAIHLLCASKKGMSAHQLHRMLGLTYTTAWFMAHRIRYAMGQPSFAAKLKGVVECDETYVGGKGKTQHNGRATGKTKTAAHHLHRYLSEFDFRFNSRKVKDGERTLLAIRQAAGKRLMLRDSSERKVS